MVEASVWPVGSLGFHNRCKPEKYKISLKDPHSCLVTGHTAN